MGWWFSRRKYTRAQVYVAYDELMQIAWTMDVLRSDSTRAAKAAERIKSAASREWETLSASTQVIVREVITETAPLRKKYRAQMVA